MKTNILTVVAIAGVMMSSLALTHNASAACSMTWELGGEENFVSACGGTSEDNTAVAEISDDGTLVLTLTNYQGGGIKLVSFGGGIPGTNGKVRVRLVGDNTFKVSGDTTDDFVGIEVGSHELTIEQISNDQLGEPVTGGDASSSDDQANSGDTIVDGSVAEDTIKDTANESQDPTIPTWQLILDIIMGAYGVISLTVIITLAVLYSKQKKLNREKSSSTSTDHPQI